MKIRFLLAALGIFALTACGGGGGGTQTPVTAPAPATADATRPSIVVTMPTSGSAITGLVQVQAEATDNAGIAGVQFQVDGSNIDAEDLNPPYRIDYDTSRLGDGAHSFSAIARDTSGNTATSAPVAVTVSNTPPPASSSIDKPAGIYSSSGAGDARIYQNPAVRGVLVRVNWSSIEPSPGTFDFSEVARQVSAVKMNSSHWSLAIHGGGVGSPDWLIDQLGAPYLTYTFRGIAGYRLPLYWDSIVQERLTQMAKRAAQEYDGDPSLKLVYVTQMSANGIEGHLLGVDMEAFKAAGYTDDRWVEAGKQAARTFAAAFRAKALAFEVHEVNNTASVPGRIINDLWNDELLGRRVGAGMWWISGKTTYQPALIELLKAYPGDIYGQVIGRSDQPERFQDNDYKTVFTQAMDIGMRYIEPWEYEVKTGSGTANGAWQETFAQFNAYADALGTQ